MSYGKEELAAEDSIWASDTGVFYAFLLKTS